MSSDNSSKKILPAPAQRKVAVILAMMTRMASGRVGRIGRRPGGPFGTIALTKLPLAFK